MSPVMWVIASGLIAASCFGMAAALFFLVRRKPLYSFPYARTVWLMSAVFAALGAFLLLAMIVGAGSGAIASFTMIAIAVSVVALTIALITNVLAGGERSLFSALERTIELRSAELEALQTEHKRLTGEVAANALELSETTQRFETTLRKAPIFVSNQDKDLNYTWVRNPPDGFTSADMLGHDDNIFPEPVAKILKAVKQRTLQTGKHELIELEIEGKDEPAYYEVCVDPMINQKGEVAGITTAAIDVTHRKRNEVQLKKLLRDVTHRAKNVLAVVNAIARQTAARTTQKDEFVDRFSARVQSLARAHDLLVTEDWQGVKMSELVLSQMSRYEKLIGSRVTCEGPELTLGPEATQNLGLAIHELAHNAGRYGALSNDTGKVDIRWSVEGRGGDRKFLFSWVESGGPPVEDDKRIGFGRTFIERAVGRTLDGVASLDFCPSGVCCRLEIPGYHLLRYSA